MDPLAEIGPELPSLARRAIESWVAAGEPLGVSRPEAPAAPVFVTLRNPDDSLRGCIGTLRAVEADVAAETARNAVLAATRDPRFQPVDAAEIDALRIEVSVLMPEEAVRDEHDLDPARYGVVVRDGRGNQGVLLPEVPGIEDAKTQVRVARGKAGIDEAAPVSLHRFEVRKFK